VEEGKAREREGRRGMQEERGGKGGVGGRDGWKNSGIWAGMKIRGCRTKDKKLRWAVLSALEEEAWPLFQSQPIHMEGGASKPK
jgi:hypothetical protein